MKSFLKKVVKVALVGPPSGVVGAVYGSGVGGYVRNMQVYLAQVSNDHVYVPFYTTVRQEGHHYWHFISRFFKDSFGFLNMTSQVDVVHIMGVYHTAIFREVAFIVICFLRRKPVVYEIKAGDFVRWHKSSFFLIRIAMNFILNRSSLILCEGMPVVDYLRDNLKLESKYLPNVIPQVEVTPQVEVRLLNPIIKLIFTGYCYEGKGVFELVNGFLKARLKGIPVELTFIGREEASFSVFLDKLLKETPSHPIHRLGVLSHPDVLQALLENDVFCMPTDHQGEGHTNSVNEALMAGMVVICTRHGFLPSILGEDTAYYVKKRDPESIYECINHIHLNRLEAQKRASAGRQLFLNKFIAEPWFEWLGCEYKRCFLSQRP